VSASWRPLRWLFLDLNSYFASVEQAEDPSLRGRPVVVSPVDADTTFAIAASYEAKAFGIRTGTRIGDAKRMCPDLVICPSRPPLYIHYHHRILEVLEDVLPVDKVCSIDEMRFRLLGEEMHPARAGALAAEMKQAIRENVAESMTCSIGIAPNAFLAKLATELQKPDGLVLLPAEELPGSLAGLGLKTFTGINTKMEARLRASGIFSSDQLIAASASELRSAFGSVIGERWWHLLRGEELPEPPEDRKSLSHSHVLSPARRTDAGCREVLLRLTHKAAARLRSLGLYTEEISVSVSGAEKSWKARRGVPATQDTVAITETVLALWAERDFIHPSKTGVNFGRLSQAAGFTPSLFADPDAAETQRREASLAMDRMNQKFGKHAIFLASLEKARESASEKIAFNKTWLFSEGKGDHDWPGTRRPPMPADEEFPLPADEPPEDFE
jgi:DNA polymerase-4